jgi:hypothetical protein
MILSNEYFYEYLFSSFHATRLSHHILFHLTTTNAVRKGHKLSKWSIVLGSFLLFQETCVKSTYYQLSENIPSLLFTVHSVEDQWCVLVYGIWNMLEGGSSSDNDLDHYVIIRKFLSLFSSYDVNQNRHHRDLVEQTGLFFRKVAYLRYDVPSHMLQTRYTVPLETYYWSRNDVVIENCDDLVLPIYRPLFTPGIIYWGLYVRFETESSSHVTWATNEVISSCLLFN